MLDSVVPIVTAACSFGHTISRERTGEAMPSNLEEYPQLKIEQELIPRHKNEITSPYPFGQHEDNFGKHELPANHIII